MARRLHPTMTARAAAVKAAHAHLTATQPGFRALPGHEQLRATQAHVRASRPPARMAVKKGGGC
jgi:hypothetical protein